MNVRRYSVLTLLSLCVISLIASAPVAEAAPFTAGNIVVYRVGDGAAALGSAATPVFLDEYTPAGAFVQTIALPTAVSGANRRLTASGTSTSEGFVSRSGNDQYLIFTGYDAAVGTAGITGTTGTAVNRIIARVSGSGTVDTSSAFTDVASGGNPRAAYSLDGLNAWAVGSTGGVRYATLGTTGTTGIVSTAVTNLRTVLVAGGQLYVSSQSGSTRLAAVDGGTPTTPGQPITNIPGFPTATGSPYNFFFADLDAGVAGLDTLYVSDDSAAGSGGGIQKWCLVGGNWVARGTITYATARGLTGSVSGTTVKLFATNGVNLATFTDSTGYNANASGSAAVLATASVNTAIRGLAFAPVVAGNNPPTITTPANPIATVAQNAAPFNVGLSGSDDGGVYVWSAVAGTGVTSVTVNSGQGTANVTCTVAIQAGFTGTATFTATLSDNVNPPVSTPVNISVVAPNNPPTITAPANPIATVAQDSAPFNAGLSGSDDNSVFNWSAVAGTGVASVVVSAGQGTANVTCTVTLQAGFSGTASFTARLSDNLNPIVTQAVNITVTPTPPPPVEHLVISQIYGGGGNATATLRNDYVELFNPSSGPIDTGGWTIQYASASGTAWQAQPLGGIVQPGEYYLIQLASGGANGALLPVIPNVSGNINMSGTTGKVALSSGGDPFDGCPLGDATLVDLVGYGTANCHEGATNAAAPSNTTATFRKTGGFTDTDVNGSDFVTGAPNPRRTAIITEIGPYVLNVDPRNNGVNAPRDASLTVTFTEDVTVSGAWFNISCAGGTHNDATVAGGGRVWIIIPNVNFIAGEQCTATIYRNFVHDVDVDDAGPNTDTLTADYSWTFTVSTGTLPPYTPDVHLTFGNPSGAVNDTLQPNNYLMEKPEYSLSYNRDRGTANWVSWHLTDEWVGSLTRVDTFRADPAVSPDWYRVTHIDYQNSGFDRGHMVPNADRDKETSIPINQATFLMSNMIPQSPDNNQGPWANLENFLRSLLPSNELYIVAGGAGTGGTGSNGFATTIANGHVTVPEKTWKCALVLAKMSGNDVLRVTAATRTICVIMPNIQGIRTDDWQNYLTSVDAVETLTGYDLFANIPDAIENAVEAGVDGANPPGVDDSSVTTNEDVAASFTLDVATPNANPLTYTILSGPSNGSLSGTDANRTYTPAPDFFGTDSFTFRVSSSSGTSNTGTVTITVAPVNDAPVAASDAKSTNEDTSLVFMASDLTANDAAGPANESTQSLTVTSVSAPATLSAGIVTFIPAPNYNGPASFTYTVCDNGTPSLCATATVNVTVNSVNDAPSASITVPSSTPEGSAVTATVSVTDVDDSTFSYAWTVTKNSSPYASGSSTSINFTPDDDGAYDVSVTVTDSGNLNGSDLETVTATNVAPVVTSISGPTAPLSLGDSASITTTYTDAGAADTHTATVTWDDSTSSTVSCAGGTCIASRIYAAPGVYGVTVVVADDDGGSDSATFNYVIVVDPNGGSVTGGGFINTPAGKGTLSLNAKYQQNQSAPTGNTQFKLAGSDLKSTSYDWLVVSGSNAQYQGTATINGSGSYGFLVTVSDGTPDTFRIQVWDKTTLVTVYDNGSPQPLGGGSIQIH